MSEKTNPAGAGSQAELHAGDETGRETSQQEQQKVAAFDPLGNPRDREKLLEKAVDISKGSVRVTSLDSLRGK